ncbi:MAG TPA: TonB-dependent receptor [Terriglobia bacterium]|nr:TonB-dependent receptor [Terriglobia bacterium]
MSNPSVRFWISLLAFSAVALLMPMPALAQTAVMATISGTIADTTGAIIPDAAITVTNTGTHQTAKTSTNPSGYYVVPNLPSGNYDVKAEKEGFQACSTLGVHLDPSANVMVNCTMQVGQVTQTIEVQASPVQVQTSESRVARTVDQTQITELPTNGRNFVSLLGLQPGVVQSFTFNSFQAMSLFASQCTQVNGLTGESNNLLIDGVPSTRTRANGATVGMPSMDGISEVNIITTGYMPEFSRAAGGQFAVVMKSGSDKYHGTVYEFVRNSAMDARYFFSSTTPTLDFNDFGFSVGGPVFPKKHNLYFYLSEEWNREVSGSTEVGTVPTAADRAGNLTAYCAVFGASVCPTVPAYLGGVDGLVAGQAFPNDTIPSSLFSANGSAMVQNFFLQPNTVTNPGTAYPYEGGYNIIYNYNTPTNAHMTDVKVDYIPNQKNHLAVTVRHFTNYSSVGTSGTGSGGASALLDQGYYFPSRGGSLNFTTTFSPTLLNDFTMGATEDIVHVVVPGGGPNGNGLDRQSLGVDYPYIIPGGAASKDDPNKIPTFLVSGFEGVSGLPYPSGSVGHIYTIQDVITKIRGNHTVKAGVWYEHDGENDHDQVRVSPGGGVGNNLNGQFEFYASNPNTTESPLADALLGNFDNYSELGWRNQTPWKADQIGFFAQDSWKLTPRFTLQGGLRWDYFQPYLSKWNNFAMFDPLFYAPGVEQVDPTTGFVTGNPYNGIAVPAEGVPNDAAGHFAVLGQHLTTANIPTINQELQYDGMARGLPRSIIGSHFRNFQPRIGFAWDPTGSGKSSIRGGAGIFYNHNTLSDVTLEGGVTPYQLAEEVFNGLADCPGSSLTASRTCSPTSSAAPELPIPMTGSDLKDDIPVVYSWNFTLEHMFFNNTLVDVGYVGNRGRHLPINADLNQPPIGTYTNPANASINADALRPYPGIGGAMTTVQEGNSKYDGLQVSVQRRLTKDLQYNVAYTYSKAFDMADSIYAVVTDTFDPKYNWQLAGFNQTHNLIFTWVYSLPFLKHNTTMVGKAFGGWEISGDLALISGFWGSPYAEADVLGNGVTDIGGTEYAYVKPNCHYRGNRSLLEFFNTSCFYQPSSGTLAGTVAPNALEGPGTDNLDFALFKNGPVWGEKLKYQFRAEFFNILNHPSFTSADTGVTDSTFGQVNGAITQRNIQLAFKLIF